MKTNSSDQNYPLLATKLYIPELRSGVVQRTRLVARLNKGILRKLTLISAPAGFGKTTLLSEWIDQTQLPVAWLSLDNGDNDPIYFMRYVIAALQRLEPKIGETTLTLLQSPQPPRPETVVINLIQEIENIPDDFVLILDDYHAIDTVKVHQMVEFLIDHMPRQMHLVMATRVNPSLPLARFRVGNELNEFRVSDLCFTMDETALFFNKVMNLGLSNQDIEMLESRTEGWVAGLQLAGLSMQGRSDIPGFIKAFAGDNRLIVDYLAEEVVNLQPAEVKDFLLQTSILDRLSEPLCDWVTDQKGSQIMLEGLERANLFLIPLDNKRCWYRYHHLFADLLRQRLGRKGPETINPLHLKASQWFEANGFTEEAIEHALAANEFGRAANLIDVFIEVKWRRGEQVKLLKWLDQLPDEFKLNKPDLEICHARLLFESGHLEAAEKRLDQFDEILVNMPASDLGILSEKCGSTQGNAKTALQGRAAAIKTYMATWKGDILGMAEYSQQALDYLSDKDHSWRAIVAISSAIALQIKGEMTAAVDALYEAVAAAIKDGNVYFCLVTRIWLAIVLKLAGRLPESVQICRQLIDEVDEGKLSFSVAAGGAWGTWGEILYELNELEEAYRYSKKGIALLEQSHDVSQQCWRYACLAKIHCSKQDLAGAEEIVPKMDKLMATSVVSPWTLTQIKAVKARLYLMKGDKDSQEKWVKECGLKLDNEITVLNEAEYVMFARILIAQGRIDDVLGLLNRLIAEAEKAGRIFLQIELLVLQAMVFKKINKETESIAAVKKALELAEPGGYIRIFVDEGPPMAKLLEKMLDAKDNIPRAFVKKLLPAFKLRKIAKIDYGLVESLSERELEVLQFIAAGLSNKKITENLFISMNTVKTHLRNIYDKLDVHSRTEAIVKARDIGLL